MRKIYYSFGLVLVAMALITLDSNAQTRYVDVNPGLGTLNDSISGDTTDLGERIDPENTVYRLKRGTEAYYGLTGSLENSGYPLTIVAEDGDGARPFLQPRVVGDGSSRPFRPKGNITLKGLHVTNMDELGGLNDRTLRCSSDSITVVLDNCWFDKDGQSFIRCDNPGLIIKVTNSVISNIGHPSSPNNGRGIDDRGNAIDTVIFENCTFYNITSRIIRDDGGTINYARMNNNTMVNIGQMGITFGPIGMLELHDNISVNAGFLPKDNDDDWIVFSVDSIIIDSVTKVAPVVSMKNNSAYLDTTMLLPYLNDTTTITEIMNPTLMMAVFMAGDADANVNLNIEFTDGPPFADSMLIYYNDPAYDMANTPFWAIPDIPGVDEGGNGLYHLDVPYDFGYANSAAESGATDGLQLGDRNWEASFSTAMKSFSMDASELSVYPMPAHSQVTIGFTLEADALVHMELYSLTGQRVADVMVNHYQTGSHQINWNAEMLETGMYILRMNAGNKISTIKMIIH